MIKNKWLTLCLIIGCSLAAAVISGIPMYTSSILQRMLTRDLETLYEQKNVPPGLFTLNAGLYSTIKFPTTGMDSYNRMDGAIKGDLVPEMGLSVIESTQRIFLGAYKVFRPNEEFSTSGTRPMIEIAGVEGFSDKVAITAGRMYDNSPGSDILEVIVNESVMKFRGLSLGSEYWLWGYAMDDSPPLKIKVVGVYSIIDRADIYWFTDMLNTDNVVFTDFGYIISNLEKHALQLKSGSWRYVFNHKEIKLDNLDSYITKFNDIIKNYGKNTSISIPALSILESYSKRHDELSLLMWLLQVPLLLVLVFYIFMSALLTMDGDKNEIAVYKSRGASRTQIVRNYLYEGIILGIVSIVIGIPLGVFLCKTIGATNGFMEFVSRAPLLVEVDEKVIMYAFLAVGLFLVTLIIPVISSARLSIVNFKQKKAKATKFPLWQKLCPDIILLGISGYSLYLFGTRQDILLLTGANSSEIAVDPLLFVSSSMFILGAGLMFIRIYPYALRLFYWCGKKYWSPSLYISLINVARSNSQDKFLMLFLIFTMSIGIFNATSARTINQNEMDKLAYMTGADMVLVSDWEPYRITPPGAGFSDPTQAFASAAVTKALYRSEPDYRPFKAIDGAKMVTKVLNRKSITVSLKSQNFGGIRLLGITPSEYAQVAWTREDLYPYHPFEYLKLMGLDERACIVASSLVKDSGLNVGDTLYLNWGENKRPVEVIIYAIVDYWPPFNPNTAPVGRNGITGMIIANYDYIKSQTYLEPYEVWMKLREGVTSTQIYEQIKEKKLRLLSVTDLSQQMIEKKNDPMLQGTNGALTMGFMLTSIITFIGFLVYWIITVKGRLLQFGILRSLGLSKSRMIAMIIYEQILVSGMAILAGVFIGNLASSLFVPVLQLISDAANQVPPFRIMILTDDYVKLFIILGTAIISGISVLFGIVSRMKIAQTLKLGED